MECEQTCGLMRKLKIHTLYETIIPRKVVKYGEKGEKKPTFPSRPIGDYYYKLFQTTMQ